MGKENTLDKLVKVGLETLESRFHVQEATAYGYETIRLNLFLRFHAKRYVVESFGNLCVMTLKSGPMQMLTFVLTPFAKDLPMFSADVVFAGVKRKSYLEFYGLTAHAGAEGYQNALCCLSSVVDEFKDLPDLDNEATGWSSRLLEVSSYKETVKASDERLVQYLGKLVEVYVQAADTSPTLAEEAMEEKRKIVRNYCRSMVEKGGASTNVFRKHLGDIKTLDFFNKVLFGPESWMKP